MWRNNPPRHHKRGEGITLYIATDGTAVALVRTKRDLNSCRVPDHCFWARLRLPDEPHSRLPANKYFGDRVLREIAGK
jgi:hypothetical protein